MLRSIEKGGLQLGMHGAFRPGNEILLPLYLSHPPDTRNADHSIRINQRIFEAETSRKPDQEAQAENLGKLQIKSSMIGAQSRRTGAGSGKAEEGGYMT